MHDLIWFILGAAAWSLLICFLAYRKGLDQGHALGFYQGMKHGIVMGRNRQNLALASKNPAWLMKARLIVDDLDAVDELIELAESNEP